MAGCIFMRRLRFRLSRRKDWTGSIQSISRPGGPSFASGRRAVFNRFALPRDGGGARIHPEFKVRKGRGQRRTVLNPIGSMGAVVGVEEAREVVRRAQDGLELLGEGWRAEVETLHAVAVDGAHQVHLLARLHALGDDLETLAVGQDGNG